MVVALLAEPYTPKQNPLIFSDNILFSSCYHHHILPLLSGMLISIIKKRLQVLITEKEYQALAEYSARMQLTMSEVIRDFVKRLDTYNWCGSG
ncbi:hypothetical protein [Microseira wollei]|nr:hypothetical protein [Microseira wollei]